MFGWDRSAQHEAASIYLHRYLKDAWHRYILSARMSASAVHTLVQYSRARPWNLTVLQLSSSRPHHPDQLHHRPLW